MEGIENLPIYQEFKQYDSHYVLKGTADFTFLETKRLPIAF